MTMARCLAVPVFQPFLHLAILPHHHRRQLTSHVIQAVGKVTVYAQEIGRLAGGIEQVINHLVVHGYPGKDGRCHVLIE